ncbi:MAG: DUF937 domain-containing protein [Betaproteobacteria bacterium]|nr:MAG: DUF937 domain-containing protein [Betaproteobacteria bacterium]
MGLLDEVLGSVLKSGGQGRPGGGGLGDLLSGLAGGGQTQSGGTNLLVALLPVVVAMLSNRGAAAGGGGLGGLLQQLQAGGLGQQTDSWVGTGENLPITREQLAEALGHDRLSQIAAQAGVSEDEAGAGLAEILPDLVNRLTPQGEMPPETQVDDSLESLRRSLGL